VVGALEKKGMRENTLIVFMSDNGGNRSALFAGEMDVSKIKLPSDNGSYRGGKGLLYEGGTRVVALANWPGHVKPGAVDGMIHMVDWLPTLASITGAPLAKSKPLDGVNVWPVISQGAPSPRTEVVYNVEPFRAAVRQGDWKLVWRSPLPSALELYNLKDDPYEKNDVAAGHVETVRGLQKRIEVLAKEMAKPMFLLAAQEAIKGRPAGVPALPNEDAYFDHQP
jgi:arylsulfatase A-like enzyme